MIIILKKLFGGDCLRIALNTTRIFNQLCNIGKALAALRTPPTAFEDLGDRARIIARGSEFPVFQRIADTNVH